MHWLTVKQKKRYNSTSASLIIVSMQKLKEITAPIQQSCECALKDYNNRIANIDNAVEEQMRPLH